MNAPMRLFLERFRAAPVAAIQACAIGLTCAGCAGNPFATAPVAPGSPAAQAVLEGARADRDYPRFSDIPKAPADARPPAAWRASVVEVEAARAELDAATAPSTWTLDGTDAFARRAQADAAPPPPITTPSSTQAFAAEARERATPPPPPSR